MLLLEKKQKEGGSLKFPKEYIFSKPRMRKYYFDKEGMLVDFEEEREEDAALNDAKQNKSTEKNIK